MTCLTEKTLNYRVMSKKWTDKEEAVLNCILFFTISGQNVTNFEQR